MVRHGLQAAICVGSCETSQPFGMVTGVLPTVNTLGRSVEPSQPLIEGLNTITDKTKPKVQRILICRVLPASASNPMYPPDSTQTLKPVLDIALQVQPQKADLPSADCNNQPSPCSNSSLPVLFHVRPLSQPGPGQPPAQDPTCFLEGRRQRRFRAES